MLPNLFKTDKLKLLIITTFFCFYGNITKAQIKITLPKVTLPKTPFTPGTSGNKKGSLLYDVIYTSWVIHSLPEFKKAVKGTGNMNSKDYGKKVIVVKTDNGSQNDIKKLPQKKVTQPQVMDSAEFSNLYWQPQVYFNNQLFPSAVISMADYKGNSPDTLFEAIRRPLGFYVQSSKSFIPLRWEIECMDKKYFDKAQGSFVYSEEGSLCLFNADGIPWDYKALLSNTAPTQVTMYFRLYDTKGDKVEKQVTVTIRSVNDCVTFYNDEDLRDLFAAYVQENDPKITGILQEALNTKMVTEFAGYQKGNAYVDLQIAAIWKVLHDQGFHYTGAAVNTEHNTDVAYSQTVRTFDNLMTVHQGNDVDGTVVFASILNKIGIKSLMVSVNGHCLLGYYQNNRTDTLQFLETTALGNSEYLNKEAVTKYDKYLSQFLTPAYLKTLSVTTKEYLLEFYKAGKDGGGGSWNNAQKHPEDIRPIDVDEQRKKGIQSLPANS